MSDDPLFQDAKSGSQPPDGSQKPRNSAESEDSRDQEAKQKKLQSLLAGLWDRSRQTVTERIEILEEAKSLAAASKLDEPARLRAVDSAHKLAGVLGTFGLPQGTELAREAEQLFERQTIIGPAEIARLGILLDDLASLVRTAGPYSGPGV